MTTNIQSISTSGTQAPAVSTPPVPPTTTQQTLSSEVAAAAAPVFTGLGEDAAQQQTRNASLLAGETTSTTEEIKEKKQAPKQLSTTSSRKTWEKRKIIKQAKLAGIGACAVAGASDVFHAARVIAAQSSLSSVHVAAIRSLSHASSLTTAGTAIGLAPTLYGIAHDGSTMQKTAAIAAGTTAFIFSGAILPTVVAAAAAGTFTGAGEAAVSAISSTATRVYKEAEKKAREVSEVIGNKTKPARDCVKKIAGFFHSTTVDAARALGRSREDRERRVDELRQQQPQGGSAAPSPTN